MGRAAHKVQGLAGSLAEEEEGFSPAPGVGSPPLHRTGGLLCNKRLKMEGLRFLSRIPGGSVTAAFFDPQYRGVLDALNYGNEGKQRGKDRSALPQMTEKQVGKFIQGIDKALKGSGHLFLWMDKFHLCMGFSKWLEGSRLEVVDMLTWNKKKIGMGYRTRRTAEYLVVLQKPPRRAKGVWKTHTIPDVWEEKALRHGHTHQKPLKLQAELIAAVSHPGDVIMDPAAGSFSVMRACRLCGRRFLGCDING